MPILLLKKNSHVTSIKEIAWAIFVFKSYEHEQEITFRSISCSVVIDCLCG